MRAEPASAPHASDFDESADDAIERRIKDLTAWLKENGPECTDEQAHLDSGSRERLYWHYGYLVALRDVQKLFNKRKRRSVN